MFLAVNLASGFRLCCACVRSIVCAGASVCPLSLTSASALPLLAQEGLDCRLPRRKQLPFSQLGSLLGFLPLHYPEGLADCGGAVGTSVSCVFLYDA